MLTKDERIKRAEERKKELKRTLETQMGCGDVQEKVHDDYDFLNKD